ncbi:hypothetical protein D7X32_24230 [Corallococcus carmarthensis]|uniref:Uncharacterized protein n=2 Tax=Corallococcus carmarthensis TaxID=2316728 RepID=A0A3A8JZ31_9BACT|nr:hypothetical protein D7X32_24230 [Corallococcus carmarthensis]
MLGALLLFAVVFAIVFLPPMIGLRQHDDAMLICLGFMATSLIGAGIRHWRLWQHATRAMQETQFV